jgi:hypothetical protein
MSIPLMTLRAVPHIPYDRDEPGDAAAGFSAAERRILIRHRPSALIVGPVSATEAVLLTLEPSLVDPLTFWQPGADLAFPSPGGTLILRNVSNLTSNEQSALLGWLDRDRRGTQIISTSPQPLMPLLEKGLFSDVLYYRLNLVYIELPDA